MWVECDANLPSGESLTRQFLYGTKFFRREFGSLQPVAWLPDSFGYSAALPQIAKLAGNRYFLTQKISWNDTNTFPHNTFLWRGIDGTSIFTHFPPSDTYSAEMTPEEIALGERQYSEKGRGRSSLMLFGWGDGGGGPTREILEAIRLQRDLEGSPKVQISTPIEFFEQAESELENPPVWEGELYLELHRGTYTTQKNMKQGNRRNESLLRTAELWATSAAVRSGVQYPYEQLESLWRQLLLLQFHDVLPGSSIAWVHTQAEEMHQRISSEAQKIIDQSLSVLAGTGNQSLLANAGPFIQQSVASAAIAVIPLDRATCRGRVRNLTAVNSANSSCLDDVVELSNERVRFTLNGNGQVISAINIVNGRNVVNPDMPANTLQLFVDFPAAWDAWDIDKSYPHSPCPSARVDVLTARGDTVTLSGTIGDSQYTQDIWLDSDVDALTIRTTVDWRESNRMLKLAFPTAVHASSADSEIQYGHLSRPITANTSWDEARFETSAQRWVRVGEPDFGVAVANDGSYGHDIRQIDLPGGSCGTQIRVSLLRSPHYPDPHADIGIHTMTVSFSIGTSMEDAIRQGYRLNVPVQTILGDHPVESLLNVQGKGVVVEAVKLAEDRSGDVIVRLYEALGNHSAASLHTTFPWRDVVEVGLLEESCDAVKPTISAVKGPKHGELAQIDMMFAPYQIVTLRFTV